MRLTKLPPVVLRQVNAIEGGFGVTDMLKFFVWDDLTLVRWHFFYQYLLRRLTAFRFAHTEY